MSLLDVRELPRVAEIFSETGVRLLRCGWLLVNQDNIVSAGVFPVTGTTYDAADHPAGDVTQVVSSDVADTTQTVELVGIDMSGSRIKDTVSLDGTTAVDAAKVFYAVEYAKLSAAAAGDVSVQKKTGPAEIHQIGAGYLETKVAHLYTGNLNFYVTGFKVKMTTIAGNITATLRYFPNVAHSLAPQTNTGTRSVELETHHLWDTEGIMSGEACYMPTPLRVPPKSYLCVTATGEGGNDEDLSVVVTGFFREG